MANIELEVRLRNAAASAQSLLKRGQKLQHRAALLGGSGLRGRPTFDRDCSETGLSTHLDMLEEWIRNPVRVRNRQVLEEAGISTDGLSTDVLDDSEGCDSTASAVTGLKEHPAIRLLLERRIITAWLKESHAIVAQKLAYLGRAQGGFVRLMGYDIPAQVRDEMFVRAAGDSQFLSAAEELARRAQALEKLGCSWISDGDLDVMGSSVDAAHQHMITLKKLTGDETTVEQIVRGKDFEAAANALGVVVLEKEALRSRLRQEWGTLSATAKLLNAFVGSEMPPESIPTLETEVIALRQACLSTLGDDGMSVLNFLRGDADFPKTFTPGQIEHALTALRPSLARALKGNL